MQVSRRQRLTIMWISLLILCLAIVFIVKARHGSEVQEDVTVRFGMLPYADHTYAIIGEKKGWFHDVGIKLDYRNVKVEDTVPFLRNGSLDVGSCSPGVIFAAYDPKKPVVSFVFGDLFQGYAIMAQPSAGYKSVQEFMKSGMTLPQAIEASAKQLRGKKFAYPTEAAIKPFIDLVLAKGELTRKDFKSLVLDDPLTVNAMRNHDADFQVGGVPSRIVLEREGYKPIISANDLAAAAKASPESPELASIFTDGWAATRNYYDAHPDVILRLASVNFRITAFIKQNPEGALAIHMPYLSQVTGQTFTVSEGRIIYSSLDPFFTFGEQHDWYHNASSPYYFENLNGAIINSFSQQGIYNARSKPIVSDVIMANVVYDRLEVLKAQTEQKLQQLSSMAGSQTNEAQQERAKAQHYYEIFDYYDSDKAADSAIKMAGK